MRWWDRRRRAHARREAWWTDEGKWQRVEDALDGLLIVLALTLALIALLRTL